jgi:TonB family protein
LVKCKVFYLALSLAVLCPGQHALVQHAREIALTNRTETENLLRQAIAEYQKQAPSSNEYAEALDLLGMTLYPSLSKNPQALSDQVEPLFRKAAEIRQKNQDSKAADLALSLELEAMVLEKTKRLEESRPYKAKARELRDQTIMAMQPPPDDSSFPTNIGPGMTPPRLLARTDASSTFEARLMNLNVEVLAELTIGSDGKVQHVEIFRPAGFGLDEAAVAALQQWKFTPAVKLGIPIAVEGTVRIQFR